MVYFSFNDFVDCEQSGEIYKVRKLGENVVKYEQISKTGKNENSIIEIIKNKNELKKFLKDFFDKLQKDTQYSVETSEKGLNVDIKNSDIGFLIGYRGETLYAFQSILSAIASKGIENRVRVILDIEGYKAKRVKALEDLAEKLEKTVIKTNYSPTKTAKQPNK